MTIQHGGPIAPGQSFTLTIDAHGETANWEPIFMYRLVWNKREARRWSLAEFLKVTGMSALAEDIKPSQAEGSILLNPSRKHERWSNKPGFPD